MTNGIYLALGSNLGNRAANIALALRMLAPLVRVEAVSSLYESAPEDSSDQPRYYNAACRVTTALDADSLLLLAKDIERLIGRHATWRGAPRPIDIDIALYDQQVIAKATLTIPHPRLTERAFVLRPLLDIDPGLTLPRTEHRLAALRAAADELTLVAAGDWWKDPRAIGVPVPP